MRTIEKQRFLDVLNTVEVSSEIYKGVFIGMGQNEQFKAVNILEPAYYSQENKNTLIIGETGKGMSFSLSRHELKETKDVNLHI
ncbi:hypothetical protein NSQ59_27205 [Margalitia sp. FSL K6-0131]|uniref:hypothetical protein n=1 Tax=Margalitia sp. FSL K6-0131 TaxID=2954604 RepID=UPI0030FB4EB5